MGDLKSPFKIAEYEPSLTDRLRMMCHLRSLNPTVNLSQPDPYHAGLFDEKDSKLQSAVLRHLDGEPTDLPDGVANVHLQLLKQSDRDRIANTFVPTSSTEDQIQSIESKNMPTPQGLSIPDVASKVSDWVDRWRANQYKAATVTWDDTDNNETRSRVLYNNTFHWDPVEQRLDSKPLWQPATPEYARGLFGQGEENPTGATGSEFNLHEWCKGVEKPAAWQEPFSPAPWQPEPFSPAPWQP